MFDLPVFMNIADFKFPPATVLALGAGLIFLIHAIPYIADSRRIRMHPGPLIAKFSDAWLGWLAIRGIINVAVHEEHITHGKIVRIAPNHVSIADVSALHIIYGHSTGHGVPLKAPFYRAFQQFDDTATIFTTQSREEHARKRKLIAHTFSQKSVVDFEPAVRKYNRILMQHWDRMCTAAAKGESGAVGECAWKAEGGIAFIDCLLWFNYQVFDIIGDLVFDGPFGMTANANDSAQIVRSRKAALDAYGLEKADLECSTIPAVKTINERSKFLISMAVWPSWIRPLLKTIPWYHSKGQAMEDIATLAVTAVARRLKATNIRENNILTKLWEAADENGVRMGNKELSGEALTLLIAGTDTTSNSSAAISTYLAGNQEAQRKLQRELDDALGPPSTGSLEDADFTSGSYDQLKTLPYLQDVINEGLRLYSTVGIGLPRTVPAGGLTILGETFTPGTVVSVPTYTVHRDKSIWGDDAEEFVPERWSRGDRVAMQKAFAPFSIGPRACIGRNLAYMEMTIFLGNLFHRYHFSLNDPQYKMSIGDGFLRKPTECIVGVKRRRV